MGKRVAIIVVLLMGGMWQATAQLTGRVRLADGSDAGYAMVLLYADSNTTASPVSYCLTTSDGRFSLTGEATDDSWLVVRMLGSKEYRNKIGKRRQLDITLEADSRRLDEVTVESSYVPVQVHGDTVAFNTDYYRTGTEETAAEVLGRIPGMEVSESGEVSFAGKSVDKILVDGKDIFAGGSDGALNTLPAEAIKGAEMLMNYRGGSIVDQFSGREMTALNLKTDGRHRTAGKASVAGGLIAKARADAAMLYMGKKGSATVTLGANNTGEALFSLEDYLKNVVGLDNVIASGGKGFAPSEEELALLMPPGNVDHSRSALATISGTYQASKKLKLKGNLMLNGKGVDAADVSEQLYSAFDALQTRSDEKQSRSLFGTGHLQATWSPSERVEVSNLVQLSYTGLDQNDSLLERGLTNMFADERTRTGNTAVKEELAVNYKSGSRSLLAAHLLVDSRLRHHTYALLTDNALLPLTDYDINPDGTAALDVCRHTAETEIAPDVTYAYNLTRKLTLSATATYSHRKTAFTYNDGAVDDEMRWDAATGRLRLAKNRGLLDFEANVEVQRVAWKSTIAGLADSAATWLLPSGSVSLVFSEMHRLTLSGAMSRNAIELPYLLRDTLVGGYSSLLAGSDITSPFAKSSTAQVNYFIFDIFSNTMFFAVAGIEDNRFSVRPHSVQDSTIASLSRYSNDGSMLMMFANASLRKGLGKWPWDATLALNATQSGMATNVNHSDATMNSTTYGVRMGLSSRRKGIFNFDFGASYGRQRNRLAEVQDIAQDEFGGYAVVMISHKSFSAQVRFAYSHVEGDSSQRDLYDLGFRAEYKLKRWRLTLRGGNLLHLSGDEWITTSASPLYLSTTTYRRLPGYLLAGVSLAF